MERVTTPLTFARQADRSGDDWKAEALRLRGIRQAILASNVANADTPGYRARDFDFAAALARAEVASAGTALTSTSSNHLPASRADAEQSTFAFAAYVLPQQASLDGNTVELDRERAALAENTVKYQLAVSVLQDELSEFKLATSDPRRA